MPWMSSFYRVRFGDRYRSNLDLLPKISAGDRGSRRSCRPSRHLANSQVLGVAAQRAITDMRRRVQEHILRLPVRYFDKTQSGQLISRIMNDAEGIRNLVGTGLAQLIGSIITAAVAIVVLFWINPFLTAINLVVLAGFGGGMGWAFKTLRPLFRERGKIQAEITGRLNQALGGVRVVKTYTAERREDLVFTRGAHKLLRNVAKSMTGVSALGGMSSVVVGTISVITFTIAGRAILAGTMTVGDLFRYIMFTGVYDDADHPDGLHRHADHGGLRGPRSHSRDPRHGARGRAIRHARRSCAICAVTWRSMIVWFEYNPGVPVIKHMSFNAPAGSTTALVGSSGSGKSTVLSLIMAFNAPIRGQILIDGRDIGSLALGEYRRHLGVVLQDNFLFDGTVAENIAYGTPEASMDDIVRVSRIAHADEFIEGFEQKYQTVVGERGVRLSGGQRQRVAIVRAILSDPRILLLDEATASLDSESEALIQEGLRALETRPHDVRHRAPAVDHSERRSDSRHRRRRGRRARLARNAPHAQRPL